jgi:flagellar hook-associated protein 2
MSSVSGSNIGFGGVTTGSGGQTKLSGTLFGVDINELVENLVLARSIPNTKRQVQIDANTAKLSAYAELEGKLKALDTAAAGLRNPRVTSGVTDIFDNKQTLSKASGSIPASELYGVSASASAIEGSYSITINRIAKADTISGDGSPVIANADTANPLSTSGNLVIEGANIAVTNTMTLNQIRDAINTASSTTKVKASIVTASTGDVRLLLKHTETGNKITLSDDQAGVLLNDLGIAESAETDTSLSAEVILDGITAIRKTNSLNDLIPGVNIELFQADPGDPINLTIDSDLEGISEAVAAFIDSYNAIVDFVQSQRATDETGAVGEDQVLNNDGLMQSAYRALQSVIGSGALGISGAGLLQTLRDIGIDLDQNGKLAVSDNKKFEDGLLTKYAEVQALFGFASNESAPGIQVVDRPDIIPDALMGQTITVRVLTTDASGRPLTAEFERGGVISGAVIENGFIKGQVGSEYEGFAVGYSGGVLSGPPYVATFRPTQGVADRIAAALKPVLDPLTGALKATKDSLTSISTNLEQQIADFDSQLDLYRTRLTLQFQAAQQAIQILESQKNSIISFADSLNGGN